MEAESTWMRLRQYLSPFWMGAGLSIIAVSYMGLEFQEQLIKLISALTLHRFVLITDISEIYSLWVGTLGVHAAVGAIAPILGYTLLSTNITAASRIAPAGAVVALEIEWSKYLRASLSLLAGSISALVLAPSTLGLLAASAATIYVILRTLIVFKAGFMLIERPEKFDAGALKYLTTAIAGVALETVDQSLLDQLHKLNVKLLDRVARRPAGTSASATLRLGDSFRATQLLRINPRTVEILLSEVEKLGYQVYLMPGEIPSRFPRGRHDVLSIVRAEEAEQAEEGLPPTEEDIALDLRDLNRIQRIFESSIVFGPGQWIDDLTRLPLLVQRHLATVIYESIPKEQPHDLSYGLDVLGRLIDAAQQKHVQANPFGLNVFDWVYDVPSFVSDQIGCAPHSRGIYTRELVNFLRGRLIHWLPHPALDELSRAYLRVLAKLLENSIDLNDANAEYLTIAIREIPALASVRRLQVVVLIERELILLLVKNSGGHRLSSNNRRMLIRTIAEVLRYTPGFDEDGAAKAETIIGALGVSLYLADGEAEFKAHVGEIVEGLIRDRYSEIPFLELLSAISRISEISERWRWSWWELDQKERGEAHFMSMELWLTRAAIVALSVESWRLSYLEDAVLPDEQTLTSMLRAIEAEDQWIKLLPEADAIAVKRLIKPINDLLARRRVIVEARVLAAPISVAKIEKFVADVMDDVRKVFGAHNAWLSRAGVLRFEDAVSTPTQAGVSRLLPREWFVPSEALDIPIMLTGSHVGRALVDYELAAVLKQLSGVTNTEVPSFSDSRVWEYIAGVLEGGVSHLLLIGFGVSEYDMYEELARTREIAKQFGTDLRFETIRASLPGGDGIFVVNPAVAFRLTRFAAQVEGPSAFEERLPLNEGGIVSRIAEITEEMQVSWLQNMEAEKAKEMKARYVNSVLDQTVWSFKVELIDTQGSRYFKLPQAATDASRDADS